MPDKRTRKTKPRKRLPKVTQHGDDAQDLAQEELYRTVAELRRQGLTYRDIGKHPLVQRAPSVIHKIIHRLREEIREESKKAIEQARAEELDGYAYLEHLLMQDYAKSRTDFSETVTQGQQSGDGPLPGGPSLDTAHGSNAKRAAAKIAIKHKMVTRTKHHGRYGDPRVASCIIQLKRLRAEVLGLVNKDDHREETAQVTIFIPHNDRDEASATRDKVYEPPKPKVVPAIVSPANLGFPQVEPLPPPNTGETHASAAKPTGT